MYIDVIALHYRDYRLSLTGIRIGFINNLLDLADDFLLLEYFINILVVLHIDNGLKLFLLLHVRCLVIFLALPSFSNQNQLLLLLSLVMVTKTIGDYAELLA